MKTAAVVLDQPECLALRQVDLDPASDADVIVDIETLSGITALTQTDVNFGSWTGGIASADTATITRSHTAGTYSTNEWPKSVPA